MTKQVQLRRGTTLEHVTFTGAVGEATVDTDLAVIVVHDGLTVGGHSLVGTKSVQSVENKTFVGVGTSGGGTNETGQAYGLPHGLDVNGTARIAGDLNLRSLHVEYREPVTRLGLTSSTFSNRITGIATNNIRVGYFVTNTSVSSACSVISIGIGTIFISEDFTDSQLVRSAYIISNNGNAIEASAGIDLNGLFVGMGVSGEGVASNATIIGFGLEDEIILSNATIDTVGIITSPAVGSGVTITGINTAGLTLNHSGYDKVNEYEFNIVSIEVNQVTTDFEGELSTDSIDYEFFIIQDFYFIDLGISSSFTFYDPVEGNAFIDNLTLDNGEFQVVGVSSAIIQNLLVSSGFSTAFNITTSYTDFANVDVGLTTTAFIEVSYSDTANINVGLTTTAFITTSYTDTSNVNVGLTTTAFIEVSYSDTANINVGLTSSAFITTSYTDTSNVNLGFTTTSITETAFITTSYTSVSNIFTGVATEFYAEQSYVNVGLTTSAFITTSYTDVSNVNTGFTTTSYTDVSNVNTGFTTTAFIEVSYTDQSNVNLGITTAAFITTSYTDTSNVNLGFTTTSVTTTAFITTSYTDIANINVGIGTTVHINELYVDTSNTRSAISTYVDVTGIGTIQELNSFIGIVTYLSGSDANFTGISTFGNNVVVGGATTQLIVTGDTRITGILTIGTESITLNGQNSSVSGISTLTSVDGSITNITGTNVNYSGISTLNNVGITTLSFVGVNTLAGNQSKTVKIQLSNTGLSSSYTLTLPETIGSAGQSLAFLPTGSGALGFVTSGLFESRYYVSSINGDDSYDGKSLPVKTIKRAAQLASFDSFVSPGNRYLDAGNLLESNSQFITEESVAYVEFSYENIGIATFFPDFNAANWKTGISSVVSAITYDIRFGGNSKSKSIGFDLVNSTAYTGEEDPLNFALEYVKFISQYIINNQSPPTLYQNAVVQSFDYDQISDPLNTNANYFHRSKDARNLIVGNRQEIIDKSLASVAIAATSGFYFPGEEETNERSRYYDSHKLIQINRQEIIDYAWNATVAAYPGISTTETKCKRDLGYFIDAISTDVFTGGNNYARSFVGFYFDAVGNPTSNGLLGEEVESVYAFQEAKVGMSSAVCNLLTNTDLTITADPLTGSNTDADSCANVRSTIDTLVGIVTSVISAGSTAGIGTTTNYGYFVVNSTTNVRDFVGIGTTNVVGGRKCARDLGLIVDAVAQDISYGTNQHIIYATKFYFDGAGVPKIDGVVDEEVISGVAFTSLGYYAKKAVTNQLNYQDFTIIGDVGVGGTNKGDAVCTNTQSTIDSLVGILTTAVLSGSLAGITSVNLGITDCADVRSSVVNYVGIITTIVGLGTTAAPETVTPSTQSKPVCIFVEAGEYLEDNPIILYDDVAVVGDNLRNTIIRPLNAGKDLFRVRNGVYVTGFAMKDFIDPAGIPQYTWDYAVAYDDFLDSTTSRTGYATKTEKPIISRSPYVQNCSILSFLGANGILVDGSKVQSLNIPIVAQEAENPLSGPQPEQGKSMVAAAFTMVSFGGIGWRTINDGYAQVVSCFQIFCRYGSLTQSGGYLSITNSATNFGVFALRSTGFSPNSFLFDRGRIAATGTSGGLTTLKVVGLGRSDQDLYVARFFDSNFSDVTQNFKPAVTNVEFTGTATTVGGAIDIVNNTFSISGHPYSNGDSIVYFGDEGVIPKREIGGLVNSTEYYVIYIDSNTFRVSEDESLLRVVDLTANSTGIHTFTKNIQEFFAKEIIDRHNVYQRLTLDGDQALSFVSGRVVNQTVSGGVAVGIAYTYNSSSRQLVVSVELSEGVRRNFVTTSGANLTIADHSGSPISTSISAVSGITTYWSVDSKIDSTLVGGTIQGVANLPEDYYLHYHRPSTINSSSHTWEYAGSGTDYNALPQNGGKSDFSKEQVSERGGRVYSSGTNELGDFKIGSFITAYNRTGNIIFNNTVTIGTLDSIRLSLSGGVAVEEFSTDPGLGSNETGGPLNSRISTQLAVRSFLSNRLGNFIDKLVSTNSVPGAVVQLNSSGQINADLIPPKPSLFFRTLIDGGRTQLVNLIPATNILSGQTVVEPTDSFTLTSDTVSQYLILPSDQVYNFENGDLVVSTNTAGAAIGIVTAPTTSGVNTTVLSFPNVGYGTTGLVKGVPLTTNELVGGSGYLTPGTYPRVRLDTSSGIGTGLTADIVVGLSGTVTSVAIQTGGFKFAVNDTLTLNDPDVIGGRTGGSNFTVKVTSVETRLYLTLATGVKFPGSVILGDYIADRNAVAITTNIGIGTTASFNPTSIDVGGDIDFTNERIVVGSGHPFGDGDPVIYSVVGGTPISPLLNNDLYYIKKVGVTSVQLFTTYGLVTIKDLVSSGTGSHSLSRSGITTVSNQIVFVNHGLTQGDPVRITGKTPVGVTTGSFYFAGSVTQNSFTLHETRAQSLVSVNGLLISPVGLSSESEPVGFMTFTKQNIEYQSSVNTSSNISENFALLSSSSLDASNIITGVFSPTRLGSGEANSTTFLNGISQYQKVITSIGIGTTQPFSVQSFGSADFPPGGVGFTTYYGAITLGLNRAVSTLDAYSTLGIAQFKTSTFSVGSDGQIQIKTSSGGGDVDASTLGGNNSAYHLNVDNHQGSITIARGGTGLSALPSLGAFLVGNGSAYQLTTTPTLQGLLTTQSIAVGANFDISFTTGTWTGEKAGKIQFHNSILYLQFTTSLIGRNASGNNVFTLSNIGAGTFSSTVQGTRLISTIATGTAPLTVSSTTQVTNLNSQYLNGYSATTTNTADAIVRRDASNQIFAGRLELSSTGSTTVGQLAFSGATNNWISFNTNGVAAPAFATRSVGTKIVLYPGISASAADYGLGIEGSTLWSGVPTTSQQFKWYGGTTLACTLTGTGNLTAVGTVQGTRLISTVATGTAPLTVTSTTQVSNLNVSQLQGFTTDTANTANRIVRRDGSGNFSAGTITATSHNITADTNNRFVQGNLYLRGGSPTIYLRDTDQNVSMIHCNSSILYVLRGATDSETWTQVNGVWPLQINLANNNATFGGTVTASSDVRFKKNIETIQDALDKVLNMRGVTFERLDTPGTEIGVIAQEIEEVIPELVTTDANGHKSVAYANISALLIEAIKAQQVQINELRAEIQKLKGE